MPKRVPVSAYTLNKLLRDVNRDATVRERFMAGRAAVVAQYDLTPEERDAVLRNDITALYKLGVHGLILRPFTLIQKMSEPDYLAAIRS